MTTPLLRLVAATIVIVALLGGVAVVSADAGPTDALDRMHSDGEHHAEHHADHDHPEHHADHDHPEHHGMHHQAGGHC